MKWIKQPPLPFYTQYNKKDETYKEQEKVTHNQEKKIIKDSQNTQMLKKTSDNNKYCEENYNQAIW